MIYCFDTNERCTNYRDYLKTIHWSRVKANYKLDHYEECYICQSVNCIELHHLTYARLGRERMSDLKYLCDGCHGRSHTKLKNSLNSKINIWNQGYLH